MKKFRGLSIQLYRDTLNIHLYPGAASNMYEHDFLYSYSLSSHMDDFFLGIPAIGGTGKSDGFSRNIIIWCLP
ncbi:hypothetical protein ACFL7D_05860 [candidate division KSB1 bacterium]